MFDCISENPERTMTEQSSPRSRKKKKIGGIFDIKTNVRKSKHLMQKSDMKFDKQFFSSRTKTKKFDLEN